MPVRTKLAKKPAAADDSCSVEKFKLQYLLCCPTAVSLPYPEKGGRRSDLILTCSAWVRASREDNNWLRFSPATVKAGFLSIHETNRQEAPGVWDIKNEQALSWAGQMQKRLQLLIRHCKQAESVMPKWLRDSLDGTGKAIKPKTEPAEAAAAVPLPSSTRQDDEAEQSEKSSEEGETKETEGGEEEQAATDSDMDVGTRSNQIAFDGWVAEYSWEAETGVRRRAEIGEASVDYAKELVKRPHLGGDAPVLAKFADGYVAELKNIVQSEKWPTEFKAAHVAGSSALPKNGKAAKRKKKKRGRLLVARTAGRWWLGALSVAFITRLAS